MGARCSIGLLHLHAVTFQQPRDLIADGKGWLLDIMIGTQGRKRTFVTAPMSSPTRLHPADVLGFSRLALNATSGMVGLVEAMHRTVAGNIPPGTPAGALIARTTAAAYSTVPLQFAEDLICRWLRAPTGDLPFLH